jgi:predicted ferric reductase
MPTGPTYAPTYAPTSVTITYSVKMTVTLDGLSVDDVDGNEAAIEGLVATQLGVDATRVVLLMVVTSSGRRRVLSSIMNTNSNKRGVTTAASMISRLLSSGATLSFQITDFATSAAASTAQSTMETYVEATGSSSFVGEINTNLGTSATWATVDESGTVDSSLSSTLAAYDHSCEVASDHHLYWKVNDGDNSVSALLYLAGSSVSQRWISLGVVEDDADTMVASAGSINPRQVYMYKPSVPAAGLFSIDGYTSDDFSSDNTARTDGITGIDMVEAGDDYVILSISYSTDTGVSTDVGLSIGVGQSNRIMWASGSAAWPAMHDSSGKGFVDVFWMDGECDDLTITMPASLWFIFMPLVLIILFNSRFSLFRIASDREKGVERNWLQSARAKIGPLEASAMCNVVMIVYQLIILGVAFAWYVDGESIARASGVAAIMNFWIALIPTSKSSLLLYLTGVPYDRAVKYHRIITMNAMYWSLIHAISVLSSNASSLSALLDSNMEYGLQRVQPIYGLMALGVFLIMTSIAVNPSIRTRFYRLFSWSHQLFLPGILLIIIHIWHTPYSLAAGFIPGLVLQLWDRIRRWSLLFTARCGALRVVGAGADCRRNDDTEYVEISLPADSRSTQKLLREWHDALFASSATTASNTSATMESFDGLGQYYFINVPGAAMTEWHPATATTHEPGSNGNITFNMKVVGPWTKKLAALAHKGGAHGNLSVKIAVDGPYGSLAIDLSAMREIVLVAGGIGITPIISILDRLYAVAAGDSEATSRYPLLKTVTVIWTFRESQKVALLTQFGDRLMGVPSRGRGGVNSVQNTKRGGGSVEMGAMKGGRSRGSSGNSRSAVAPQYTQVTQYGADADDYDSTFGRSSSTGGVLRVNVTCYATGEGGESASETPSGVSVKLMKKRPEVDTPIFEAAMRCREANAGPCGVVVCGPDALTRDVRAAARSDNQCDGWVELHTESFAL